MQLRSRILMYHEMTPLIQFKKANRSSTIFEDIQISHQYIASNGLLTPRKQLRAGLSHPQWHVQWSCNFKIAWSYSYLTSYLTAFYISNQSSEDQNKPSNPSQRTCCYFFVLSIWFEHRRILVEVKIFDLDLFCKSLQHQHPCARLIRLLSDLDRIE